MRSTIFKVLVSSSWPLAVHLGFTAVAMAHDRLAFSSLKFIGVLILAALCLWHCLSRGVLPIVESCCQQTTTYDRAHVVSLYHRHNLLFFPWRRYAEIKLSNEQTGLTWIGNLDPSICKDARVKITFCKRSRIILSIEAAP